MKNCPICKNSRIAEVVDWDSFKIFKCNNCKLVYAQPLPTDEQLLQFYQGFLFKQPKLSGIEKEPKNRKKELKYLFNLSADDKTLMNKTFLDYGGGTGIVFKAVTDLGLAPFYYDIDQQAIEFTKNNFGMKSDQMILEIETCQRNFDFIFSYNVIEHIKNPLEFITKLYKKLEVGGTLILKTPNTSNTETYFNPFISVRDYVFRGIPSNGIIKSAKIWFTRSWHCDSPRHIYSFSKKSFDSLIEQMGISNENYEIGYYSTPWFSNTPTKQFFSKDKHGNFLKSLVTRLITWPVVIVEFVLQSLKWLFLKLNLVSPGGITLKINR